MQIFSSSTLTNCEVIGHFSWLLINTESDKSGKLFWETTVYLEWMNEGMKEASLFTRYSLLVRNLLVTQWKITRYSLYNLLVITSKPTRYHLKTYSLLFKNLVKIHQKFFCDKLSAIWGLPPPPPPIVSSPSNFLLKIRDIAFSPGGGGIGKNLDRGAHVIFCEFEIWEIVIFSGCSKWWLF